MVASRFSLLRRFDADIEREMPEKSTQRTRKNLPHLASLQFANQTTMVFLTLCVDKRRPLLARREVVELLLDCWRGADRWLVGRWVIMPDHLHLFCAPAIWPNSPVKSWIRYWRSEATRYWPFPNEKPIWQRDFFDRQLRSGESYSQKWRYLWENPIASGLVARPEDWPFQGEMNAIPWHEPV